MPEIGGWVTANDSLSRPAAADLTHRSDNVAALPHPLLSGPGSFPSKPGLTVLPGEKEKKNALTAEKGKKKPHFLIGCGLDAPKFMSHLH